MLVSSSGLISASSTDRHWTAGAVLVLVLRSEQLPEHPHDEDEVNDPQGLPYFTISEMEQFEERGTCTELFEFLLFQFVLLRILKLIEQTWGSKLSQPSLLSHHPQHHSLLKV
jgi:hypothetical protein